MVRETRHLWVGNLPDNIREDRIREHFKRYGRVQNVKLLGRTENAVANASAGPSTNASGATISSGCGICATVAFMDIKSASKAHNAEHVLDERTLTTEYYEPAAIPSATGAPSAGSSPAGSGYSGSSSSVNSAPAPVSAPRYHLSGGEENSNNACAMATAAAPANWRGTNDSATEYCRRGNTPASYGRTTPHHRWYGSAERTGGATGGESTPSTPGAPEGRRRRNSGSGTSRSDSSSPEPSDTSRASTPAASHNHNHHTNHRLLPPHHQWAATASGRPLAICVRNLPTRSTDSSLKDGLYHEYKKHGKVVWVKVVGQNADRYAVVRFKKPSDVEKALEVSQDKLFFGCKISVAPHQSCDEDADTAKPYETDIDEYHPKATKTLFIGNLEKEVTQQQLREKFKHFGRIIEIDIKKGSSGGAGYAFCQYASISSVVEAIRVMDGEYVGGSRVKLGFGKPVATTCVWVDGLSEHTEKQVLGAVARCGAATSVCVDRAAGAALVHFEQAAAAGAAVRELRRVAALASSMEPDHPRLCVDYASRECQDAFYEQLEKHGGSAALASSERLSGDVSTRYAPTTRHDTLRYDGTGPRSRGSSYGRASSRTPRYSSVEHYDPAEYAADRRYRVYEELASSPPAEETPYEDRLQSVVVSPHRARRHRRDSDPEERKHSKERHRSAGGVRRSRSGSRRHRRRREGSGGTPLRDELDVPVEPRRPPRDRPPLPMSLPLPKFAAQLLRTAPTAPRPAPTPAPAPASPPRPPSASSSSGGSAPHSPSLEERIRSLNEKYEKWNGSRAAPDAPDRSRLRHRLLEVDINEVKPSEVVRSLLAKRSVFDEDSERLEGATRAPSPVSSPRPRSSPSTPRAHRYSFPTHLPAHGDPRLERPERPYKPELLTKLNELDYGFEPRSRRRTPSTDKSQIDTGERRHTPPLERDRANSDRECKKETDIGDSLHTVIDNDSKFDSSARDTNNIVQVPENDYQNSEKIRNTIDEILESSERTITAVINEKMNVLKEHVSVASDSFTGSNVFELKSDCLNKSPSVQNCNPSEDSSIKSDFGIKCEPLKSDELKPLDSDNKFYFSKHPVKSDDDKCKDIFIHNHIKKELAEFEAQQNKLNISNTIKGICDTSHDTVKVNEKNNKERFNQNVILEAIQNNKFEKENIHFDKLPEEEKQTSSNTVFFDSKMFVSEKVAEDKSKIDCDKTRTHKDRLDKDKHNLDKTITSKSEKTMNKNDTKEKNLKADNHEDLRHSIDKADKNKVERDIEKLHKGKGDRDSERSIRDYDKFNNDNEKSNRDTEKCSRDHEKSNRDSEKCSRDHEKSNRDSEKSSRDSDKSNRDSEKSSRDSEKSSRDLEKSTRELEKSKHSEEKLSRTDHHRKEKLEKDKRKDNMEFDFLSKVRRDDKYKHDRTKKDVHESKRDRKDADSIKSRKSSRDETSRDLCRKDSTDSSASRTSHDSARLKDFDHSDMKDENKVKLKSLNEGGINKIKNDKDLQMKNSIINCTVNCHKLDESVKLKPDEKGNVEETSKSRSDHLENTKPKDLMDKQRHYSLDSPSVDSKRKERLNSCSSLPSNISYKRRMSSQDSFDSLNEESKKVRNETKVPERRDSRDNRSLERHKTTKFNKGHFAKIIESKTKDDKKNQVKPPDANCTEWRSDIKDLKQTDRPKFSKRSPKGDHEEKFDSNSDIHHEGLQNDLDFLATLELRSSEEDEKQRALRKEMKEKKRIQQLQQIQELQMKQDALQQAEIVNKLKEDKKQKSDEKKKEIAREKRFSTDRKSREDKIDPHKRKNRKQMQSTDSSDSDEPKKHSIFDIVDDEPTYISMYDKVKARSCKNMQKQEEEKRQEKIKAKFSQLKQSRAKREEKKRSSWDEDSDSDHERRKLQKNSMGSSSDDEQNKKRNKPHRLSLDYDCNKSSDFFYLQNEEDSRNKLSRKNSRTRIMSDSSDDEVTKRSSSKSPNYLSEVKKELISDSETLLVAKDDIDSKRSNCDRIKKSSLLNLFGKSDSDDIKIKPRLELDNDYKSSFLHLNCNDFSSESESVISNRLSEEIRKKHKRKQKKHKFSFSDDEIKKGNNETTIIEDTGNKHSEKPRRHSNKKEKRKDKNRESFDTDETRDEKVKLKKKKSIMSNFDVLMDIPTNSIKKEGKMEDIFGPLSDESDKERSRIRNNSADYNCYDISYHTVNDEIKTLYPVDEAKLKEREDKRKKEKRRKEKRYIAKDDENSLDVDAVSKAIEARLFADTISDDDNRVISQSHNTKYDQKDLKHPRNDSLNESINDHSDKNIDKVKKDFREKKKKKKKYREDRQSRKDHQYFHHHDAPEKSEHSKETPLEQTISQNNLLLDIPLPKDAPVINTNDDTTDSILLESSSLPRLTESPPGTNNLIESTDMKSTSDTIDCLTVDENESKFITCNNIEMKDIPMPPPIESMVQDINSVPLPSEPLPTNNSESSKSDNFSPSFVGDDEISENAVRSISNLENEIESTKTKNDSQTSKPEDIIAEKPRAIISQEETEDAVAALLGESFGGKDNTFETCYEEVQTNTSIKTEIGSSIIENENIPEEDAEEMRQAVQNLNASEMEVKPDTPVSDNDLLLIDTDTEETDEAPINAKATNQTLSINITDQPKTTEMSNTDNNILLSKPKSTVVLSTPNELDVTGKPTESDIKIALTKRETVQQATSTATPVITSWTLANHKLIDPHVLNIQKSQLTGRESENKSNANIVQLKGSQNQPLQMNTSPRPIITSNRINAPSYQVINQMMRPQISNMQPPTIKIPEPHILYQKSQGIVISPRTSNDVRLQSPKASPQNENITSPRLANMTILSTSPPVINSVGIPSPNALQQRSPGQVTVVRMQQPPLSPIQAVHLPPGARAMVSPNRPNSVLVQQGTPIHFNRLPVTPVLAPISKQITSNAIVQQNKGIVVNSSPLIHQQKVITAGDFRKNDPRIITDSVNESSKIILSPTNLQQSTNPTVMAQNRLISMQNAMLINNMNQMNEKRDHIQKPEQHNHISFNTPPIIHVTAVNHSTSIIHSATKSAMCSLQEGVPLRGQTSNVIHTLNSQKLLTTTPMSNIIQLEKNKTQPSVLSMATIRPPSVLTKLESSKSVAITTSTLTNVVMTPLLLKSTSASGTVRLNTQKQEKDFLENKVLAKPNHLESDTHEKNCSKISTIVYDSLDKHRDSPIKPTTSPADHLTKCETDFEELLKDNTNEIKISNDTEKKLEVNVGKIITLLPTTAKERKQSIDSITNEIFNKDIPITKEPATEVQISDNDAELVNGQEENPQNPQDSTVDATQLGNTESEKVVTENITRLEEVATSTNNNDLNKISKEINVNQHTFKTHEVSVTTCGDKSAQSGNSNIQIKNSDEVGLRSTKDINMESVIKKVDVLCHDLGDTKDMNNEEITLEVIKESSNNLEVSASINKPELTADTKLENVSKAQPESNVELDPTEGLCIVRGSSFHKRGGRSGRGKRSEKNPDRGVQTRQIAKPPRNATSAKRGRGRAKLDKKIKNIASNMTNNIPGDVYDFHEDSGEEDSTSSNKSETRPRLILTIKSPLSGNCNAIATSTLSIAQKDQLKGSEKLCKNEKAEDFASPSLNTRKSRRLQEKDVARGSGEDSGENSSPVKVPRENKKKSPKQGVPKGNQIGALDTRKSPRGAKRTRDRSLSTTSIDSNEEKLANRADDGPREAKVPKLAESPSKIEVDSHVLPKSTSVISSQPAMSPAAPAPVPTPAPIPMPIMKPPKKMISEIAKLGGAFEGTPLRGLASPNVLEPSTERTIGDNEKQPIGGERRLVDNVPVNMVPVGATEATDARVQSPALPHVPQASSAPHRPADRATPILIRGGESEGCGGVAGVASGAGVCAGGVAAGARGAGSRGFVATPSLPRGAHLPTHPHHAGSGSRVNITSIPTLSPQGPGPLGEGMYFSHQHYHVYQHHFRATQHENRATPPYTRSLEAEGSEAPTPPLELRRPPTARVPRPAHSPLPADRHIMYAAGCGRSPPPAHGTSRMPGALPPLTAPGPPHASQVPREADSLQMLLRRYPVMWQGLLALKNDSAAVQMHFVGGNPRVAGETLPRHTDGSTPPLRIAQRMRLEPIQLDQVHRKMKVEHEHCILLALPCGRDHMDVLQQSTNLTAGFITYMQRKQAAGIVNIAPPGHDQALYTVHIFPSCDFANEKLSRIAPDLMHRVADIAHLLIVIATV